LKDTKLVHLSIRSTYTSFIWLYGI